MSVLIFYTDVNFKAIKYRRDKKNTEVFKKNS